MHHRPVASWTLLLGLASACGPSDPDCGPEAPCPVEGGEYIMVEPDAPTGDVYLFLHGAMRTSEEMLRKIDEDVFLQAGMRLILPDPASGRWSVSNGEGAARDDAAFLAGMVDELRDEGMIDGRVVVGGHSVGSSMAWYAGCYEPEAFDGVNATSGGFWAPMPTECEGPVPLRHTHGTADTLVPLEGRTLGGGAVQEDIFAGLDVWSEANGCDGATVTREEPGHECTVWQGCEEPLEICLHDDGHVLKNGWEERALQWIDAEL